MHNDDANKDGNIVSIGFKIQVGKLRVTGYTGDSITKRCTNKTIKLFYLRPACLMQFTGFEK